ncbi:ABC transporter permease [Mucilaginibacter gotjawali]|uniref:ABC-2 type transport system permease protein n=2 Tax=Mucilaginibacter gotjawali TaxID=1550579 RepID=A0A839SEK0_9SPHI|nr:ABC transporter permease [Mucilaginibacter gotjawali]MBB3055320.1 ABC-2 type transport system permease protein [Mucilaginibacter gotjawali]BAU53403.1 ABC-2 type transporter [Mucilaginibacter gotjawali]
MATLIPKTSTVLTSLLRADFTTQWRNRRAVVLTLVVPLIILTSWKGLISIVGGPFVLANSITIGLFASGLMGYANATARDRDKGIFQRLRVAPVPSWAIMASRLLVQLAMILIITTAVFVIGKEYDGITLSPAAYVFTYFTAIIGGAVSLSLGQMVVGWIKNPETINSTTRLIYLAFIMVGMFGELNKLGETMDEAVQWSPYGAVKTILSMSMEPDKWNNHASMALLVTIAYITIFTTLGIKWFKWNTK